MTVDVGGDVTVANPAFRPTVSVPLVSAFFTLRVDGVSQEIMETFTITLMLNEATVVPELLYPNISVSIMDRDSEFILSSFIVYCHEIVVITFEITDDDYRESEGGDMEITVAINQDITLVNPVTVRITPLTVQMALDRGIIATFDEDDALSPNRAGNINLCTVKKTE